MEIVNVFFKVEAA